MNTINSGDTAWVLISALLIFFMIPGLTFLYGNFDPQNSALSILKKCLMVICLVSLQWVIFGYSLSFGPDHNGWIGTLAWAGLRGVDGEPNMEYCAMIPHQAFMIFHMMIAVLTPVLILNAFAERVKFSALCIFTLLWSTVVYDPIAHWMWSVGGFLRTAGAMDFAGGIVVQISAGMAALAAALVLGKQQTDQPINSPSPQLPMPILGAGMVWLGWLGLTGGSALGAGALAAGAMIATLIAASAAAVIWTLMDGILKNHPTPLGMITGIVVGLVAITPAAGFVGIGGAIAIGMGAAVSGYIALSIVKNRFGNGQALGAFGIHGIGGLWGVIATGLWATKSVNSNGADGLFYGHPMQLAIQIKAALATAIYSFAATYVLLKIIETLIGLQTSEHSERT